jgi:hypothetical protein
VDSDTHLLALAASIHLNLVRAKMLTQPAAYPWSSHRAYRGGEQIPWLSADCVLSQFSWKEEQSRRMFAEFVAARISAGHLADFFGKGSLDSRIIGQDQFVEGVLGQTDLLPLQTPSLSTVLGVVTNLYGLSEEDLRAAGQVRIVLEARSMAVWALRELTDGTLGELAERLGRDASTLIAAIRQVEVRSKHDLGLAEKTALFKGKIIVTVLQA